ncbi:hypothetical protein LCGC14_1013120 [marine sediment metagenome]|uniref:Phosphoadenosine phosphosulphate reductase domain-containing protein n=1 Tax=marine sediment metagenome TaxID=412755 RepID=A0A0F9R5U4_9ZZZZ
MKKSPSKKYEKEFKQKPYIGLMASESRLRMKLAKKGCNTLEGRATSNPLLFWTHENILEYIKQNNVKISEIYSMGYERTGCVFCMFGIHLEDTPNRFQLLKQTHPKLWTYCMDKLDLRTVLDYIKIPYEPYKNIQEFIGGGNRHA